MKCLTLIGIEVDYGDDTTASHPVTKPVTVIISSWTYSGVLQRTIFDSHVDDTLTSYPDVIRLTNDLIEPRWD